MGVSRRQAVTLCAAIAIWPWPTKAEGLPPPVFADFERPPDRGACEAAIEKGADFLSAPVCTARDGVLMAVADSGLSEFTDVARRAEFADRRASRQGGAPDWFAEDFTSEELKSVAVIGAERSNRGAPPPRLLTFADLVAIAQAGSIRKARVIGLAPRLPDRPAANPDLDPIVRLAQSLRLSGYNAKAAAALVLAREPAQLLALGRLCAARRVQIIDAVGGPAEPDAPRFAAMIEASGLAAVRGWAEAIAPAASLLIPAAPKPPLAGSGLTAAAHGAGLAVFVRAGAERDREVLRNLLAADCDGLMADDPGVAVKARDRQWRQRRASD